MGFFKNMLDEAGTKAGKAIGNSLWGDSTDYYRVGDMGSSRKEEIEHHYLLEEQARESRMIEDQMRYLMSMHFSTSDVRHNISILADLCAIIESLPGKRFLRNDEQQRLFNAAKSKFEAGRSLCQSMAPDNEALSYFSAKSY